MRIIKITPGGASGAIFLNYENIFASSKLDLASYALMMMMKGPKVWITICKTQMDEEEWLLGGSMRSQSFSDQFSAFTMATRPSALGMSDPIKGPVDSLTL